VAEFKQYFGNTREIMEKYKGKNSRLLQIGKLSMVTASCKKAGSDTGITYL
jgi:hypothetical protein